MKRLPLLLPVLLLGLALGAALVLWLRSGDLFEGPDPVTVATASLQSMQEQARLTPFAARYVAVVTSRQQRFGLSAERTLIMPGTVRYEVDLAKLQRRDLRWDPDSRTLSVTLPNLEISQPQIDLDQIKVYGDGGLLTALTNADQQLDAANRVRGQNELLAQARQPVPMRLARDAARRAVERSFALPLQAAGLDAKVTVRFGDERVDADTRQMDRSRSLEEVWRERQQRQP